MKTSYTLCQRSAPSGVQEMIRKARRHKTWTSTNKRKLPSQVRWPAPEIRDALLGSALSWVCQQNVASISASAGQPFANGSRGRPCNVKSVIGQVLKSSSTAILMTDQRSVHLQALCQPGRQQPLGAPKTSCAWAHHSAYTLCRNRLNCARKFSLGGQSDSRRLRASSATEQAKNSCLRHPLKAAPPRYAGSNRRA